MLFRSAVGEASDQVKHCGVGSGFDAAAAQEIHHVATIVELGPFQRGAEVEALIAEGVFHPHMRQRIPAEITHVYGHQDEAIRAIHAGRTTLVSTGTGSGKSECFLYPIVSKCLTLRDAGAEPGISAVIVYPMNALAEDQLGRLRGLLAGTGISFGMYVGKTPEKEAEVAGIRLPKGASRADYEARLKDRKSTRLNSSH